MIFRVDICTEENGWLTILNRYDSLLFLLLRFVFYEILMPNDIESVSSVENGELEAHI